MVRQRKIERRLKRVLRLPAGQAGIKNGFMILRIRIFVV